MNGEDDAAASATNIPDEQDASSSRTSSSRTISSTSRGFKVTPARGHAVVFYNLLPDGNADDLSVHEALPVSRGRKWLANIWVWDPKMRIT